MKNSSSDELISNAKVLRKSLTDVERLLWSRLRGEQMGVKFRKQHPFMHFVLDFVCLELKIVVELDGSQHVDAANCDEYRTKYLQDAGYSVLRFWNNQVTEEFENVLEEIYRSVQLIKDRNPSPPQPSP